MSFVYAKCNRQERVKLWDELRDIVVSIEGCPWMVGGDFNIFLHLDERAASDVDRLGEMVDFIEAVADCELVDAGCVGSPFTWHKRELFERLDRIFYTEPWLSVFPVSTVTHLPGDPSNHYQLLFIVIVMIVDRM
ncbi:hypothetical protein ACS0TY_030928 [Phlomoides rotata]